MRSLRQYRSVLVNVLLLHYIETCFSSLQASAHFVLSGSGRYLTEHLISEHETNSVTECAHYCLRKPSICKSINFKAGKRIHHSSKNCQLNSATKSTVQPQNFLPNDEYNYYEPILREQTDERNDAIVYYEKSCDALYKSGKKISGVYNIDPDGQGVFEVRCDMTVTPGSGWTIFQRRIDGSVDFYRGWDNYKRGFGNKSGEFWLGLDKIHRLTASGQTVLRVDLESYDNDTAYASYGRFLVGNEQQGYILNISEYTGNAGDSLSYHNGMMFTTKDRDNDYYDSSNCAQRYSGAFWYNDCLRVNLNGKYFYEDLSLADGIHWNDFKAHGTTYYDLKTSEMKVRSKTGL